MGDAYKKMKKFKQAAKAYSDAMGEVNKLQKVAKTVKVVGDKIQHF